MKENKIKHAKEILDITENLLTSYIKLRNKGHTTLLKEGTDNYRGNKIIIVSNSRVKDNLFKGQKDILYLDHFKTNLNYPILSNIESAITIDNSAMMELLDQQSKALYNLLHIIQNEN